MARFLNGLNEEISGFVEMFPYHNLQGLIDQAMRTERKIQQEGRGRPYGNRSISAPWRRQQAGTSVVGGRSQGVASRTSPSFGATKKWFLLPLPLKFRKKHNDLLQVQQPLCCNSYCCFFL